MRKFLSPMGVRLTRADQEQLRALAELEGRTASDCVRRLIRREYIAAFGTAAEPRPLRQAVKALHEADNRQTSENL